MFHYTNEQLATLIALPIVTILLVWTTAIFQRNRRRWGPYDIPIVSILVLSIIRNMTILGYTLFMTLNQNTIDIDYCSGIIWIFNSIHTFQASCLTTLAIIGLFSVKLHRKQQHIRQFLTSTHVIYHLFCLTTLCACVGVAAILAQDDRGGNFKNITVFETNPCKFMPFDLDIKFNVFVIVLNVFLAVVSLISFLTICFNHYKIKSQGFDYLKKSSSDLSDLSLPNNFGNENKNYYDTYTIHRANQLDQNYYEGQNGGGPNQNQFCNNRDAVWNSDVSNISTTVSSTNSRRPCLGQSLKKNDENRTGLETIHPVLIVCYLFYHLPIITLCTYPNLVSPWSVAGVALWLGLVQDLLIPIGLSIVDSRFCKWVSNVYKCKDKHGDDKLPHVGLDGKFRPFSSQPQSLEVAQTQHVRTLQTVEHRFPITNGSLYTSIDGRLPVIHNYRRHKDQRGLRQPEIQTVLQQSTHLRRPDFIDSAYQPPLEAYSCRNCETDLCPSHSNLHHLSPHYINKQLNLIQQNNNILINSRNPLQKRISLSQESLRHVQPEIQSLHQYQAVHHQEDINPIIKHSRNLVRLNKMRLCKSEDSLNEVNRDLREFKQNPELFQRKHNLKKREMNEQILDYSSSDEEYLTDVNNDRSQNFDSLSSQSSFSITTEANCDFDFFQNNDLRTSTHLTSNVNNREIVTKPKMTTFKPEITITTNNNNNFKITRSNSKRSLENLQVLKEETEEFRNIPKVQRSNSFMTLEDRNKKRNSKKLLRSNSKLSDCTHNIRQKIKSVEYLPSSNASTVFIEDVFYFNYPNNQRKCIGGNIRNYVGSVPDLKKVFISEYI